MKKKTKITLIAIGSFIVLYGVMFFTDMNRVKQLKKPIFCVVNGDMGSMTIFDGLGYKIGLDINSMTGEITCGQMTMLGQTIVKLYKEDNELTYIPTEVENVSISIADISLIGATITIKDTNKKPYTYEEWYKLEKQINGKWREVETIIDDYGFNEMAYVPNKNNEVKFVIDWEWLYGKLSFGSYRILKKVGDNFISIEFGIAITSDKRIEVIKPEIYNAILFNKYLERDNRIIYLAGNIEEIYYTASETRISLKDYISKSYQTFDDSIKHLTDIMDYIDTLNDGGTTIYKSSEYDITLIKCNTLSGNRNVFIGDYSMNFDNDSMCK